MIKVKAIITEKGSLKPEMVPDTKFGSHCDDSFFYFFESNEDAKRFYDNQPVLPQSPVKSEFMGYLEKATNEELDFLAQKLKDRLK